MKRNFKKLLGFALATYATVAAIKATDNYTAGTDCGLAYVKIPDFYNDKYVVAGGTSLLDRENRQREDCFGGGISVVLGLETVVSGSRGSQSLGKGFSPDAKSDTVTIQSGATGTLDIRKFIHEFFPSSAASDVAPFNTTAGASTSANVSMSKFEANHKRWFADLSYMQDLGNFYEGLKFSVSTTLVSVKNNLSVEFGGMPLKGVNLTSGQNGAITAGNGAEYCNNVTMENFFRGANSNAENTADTYNAQAKLRYGRFTIGDQSQSGLTDIRTRLSLDILDNDNAKVSVALDGVLPVGRELKLENLFEPVVGNRHFKLGAWVGAEASLAEGSDYSANLQVQGLWHYAFPRNCSRLPWDKNNVFGQYALGYMAAGSSVTLEPLINHIVVSQPKVNVKPGQSLSLIVNGNIEKGSLVIDAGYNLRWSAAESNDGYTEIPSLCLAISDNTAGTNSAIRAKKTSDTDWSTSVGGAPVNLTRDFTTSAAGQVTHDFYLSLGFLSKEWQYPSSVSLQAGYDIAQNRSRTPERWHLSVKGSFFF